MRLNMTASKCSGNIGGIPATGKTRAHSALPAQRLHHVHDEMLPRVVLLTKPYPLAAVLESRIAATGCLVGVVHEQKPGGVASARKEIRRLITRLGLLRALDVLAYQAYQRVFRAGALRRLFAGLASTATPVAVPRSAFASLNSAEAR